MAWLYFCSAAGAQRSVPEPAGKSQVGEGSGALKPSAQGDSGSPGAVSYSPMGSCCIRGARPWGWGTPLKVSSARCAQLCLQGQCGHHWIWGPRSRARGALGAARRQPRVDSSRRGGGGGRIPPPPAPWRGRQRGTIISIVLLGGEGLVPERRQPSSGSGGVSINRGKA